MQKPTDPDGHKFTSNAYLLLTTRFHEGRKRHYSRNSFQFRNYQTPLVCIYNTFSVDIIAILGN